MAVSVPAAQAVVIYNNFGAGDSFDVGSAWVVSAFQPQDIAMPFTVLGADHQFISAELALEGTSPLNIMLMSDAGGLPGTVIETINVPVSGIAIVTATSVLQPTLLAGTTYWIATSSAPSFLGGWKWTSPLSKGLIAASFDSTASWDAFAPFDLAAFRVNGTLASAAIIPEPATASLGLLALTGLMLRRRRMA